MNYLFPICFLDPPEIFNASVTNIPGSLSLPLQVIAETPRQAAFAIDYIDTTGDYIGIYQGAVGQEILKCIVGNGLTSRASCVITANSRISVRSMNPAAITNGKLTLTLVGV